MIDIFILSIMFSQFFGLYHPATSGNETNARELTPPQTTDSLDNSVRGEYIALAAGFVIAHHPTTKGLDELLRALRYHGEIMYSYTDSFDPRK